MLKSMAASLQVSIGGGGVKAARRRGGGGGGGRVADSGCRKGPTAVGPLRSAGSPARIHQPARSGCSRAPPSTSSDSNHCMDVANTGHASDNTQCRQRSALPRCVGSRMQASGPDPRRRPCACIWTKQLTRRWRSCPSRPPIAARPSGRTPAEGGNSQSGAMSTAAQDTAKAAAIQARQPSAALS